MIQNKSEARGTVIGAQLRDLINYERDYCYRCAIA